MSQFLAKNTSFWGWEYDDRERVALIFSDVRTGILRLGITETHTKSGLGAGVRKTVIVDTPVGTLGKPDLRKVIGLLKRNSFEKSSAGSPFKRDWVDSKGNRAPLSKILDGYRSMVRLAVKKAASSEGAVNLAKEYGRSAELLIQNIKKLARSSGMTIADEGAERSLRWIAWKAPAWLSRTAHVELSWWNCPSGPVFSSVTTEKPRDGVWAFSDSEMNKSDFSSGDVFAPPAIARSYAQRVAGAFTKVRGMIVSRGNQR